MTRTQWVEKHRPETWSEIQGQDSAVSDIRSWIEGWSTGDEPQLLVGPPGTGKTTTAYVAADEAGLPVQGINASEARKTDDVRELADELGAGDKLVLLDEVDSWHHAVRLDPLVEELSEPGNPVMMTANEEHEVPYALKSVAEVHEFKLRKSSRRAKVRDIAEEEGIPLSDDDLEALAERPDLRSAINDLQLHARAGVPIGDDDRAWGLGEFEALDGIIKEGEPDIGEASPASFIHWLDQNLRKEYRGLEAAVAYDALARADKYLGLSGQGDYWGWKYAAALLEETANVRLSEPYTGWIRWEFPEWFRSKEPKPTDEDEEAALYRELKGDTGAGLFGSYAEFREVYLPILQSLPSEERAVLARRNGLSEEARSALGVTQTTYNAHTPDESAEAGEELPTPSSDASGSDWG